MAMALGDPPFENCLVCTECVKREVSDSDDDDCDDYDDNKANDDEAGPNEMDQRHGW